MKVTFPEESSGFWVIEGDKLKCIHPTREKITLKDSVLKVEVIAHSEALPALAGRDGLPRAAAGAVLGFLIAGPIGTLAGAGLGASGATRGVPARSESNAICITFKHYKYLIGDVTPFELEQLRGFLEMPFKSATDSVENPASKVDNSSSASKAKRDPYLTLPEPINGRTKKQKPFPISEIILRFGDAPESKGNLLFFRHLQVALDCLNTIKWRYYDLEIETDSEVFEAIKVALAAASYQISQISSLAESKDEVLESLIRYFDPKITAATVKKAWGNPKPSSVIGKTAALNIFKICRSFETRPLAPTRAISPNGLVTLPFRCGISWLGCLCFESQRADASEV